MAAALYPITLHLLLCNELVKLKLNIETSVETLPPSKQSTKGPLPLIEVESYNWIRIQNFNVVSTDATSTRSIITDT